MKHHVAVACLLTLACACAKHPPKDLCSDMHEHPLYTQYLAEVQVQTSKRATRRNYSHAKDMCEIMRAMPPQHIPNKDKGGCNANELMVTVTTYDGATSSVCVPWPQEKP